MNSANPSPQWDDVDDEVLMLQLKNGMKAPDLARYYNVPIDEVEIRIDELGFIEDL